jgi:hypothetical protein
MAQVRVRHIKLFCTVFAATIGAFLIFTATAARAEPDQVIYECVNNSSGTTHIITPTPSIPPDPLTACHHNETLYTIEGAAGSSGPSGPGAPTGVTGITGATATPSRIAAKATDPRKDVIPSEPVRLRSGSAKNLAVRRLLTVRQYGQSVGIRCDAAWKEPRARRARSFAAWDRERGLNATCAA